MLAAPLSLWTLAWLSATGLWPEYSLHFNCFLFSLIFSDVTVIVAKEGIEPSFCGYEPHILAVRWPCNKNTRGGTWTRNLLIKSQLLCQLSHTDAVVCLTTLLHPMGLEPTSYWLKVSHSTIKLQVLKFLLLRRGFSFLLSHLFFLRFFIIITNLAGFEPAVSW